MNMMTAKILTVSLAGAALLGLVGCTALPAATQPPAAEPSVATTASAGTTADVAACDGQTTPSAALTEGPYYVAGDFVRSDITEGQAGMPMTLTIQIVDSSCTPVPNARVDIWHANAQGQYSGVTDPKDGCAECGNMTFLRGTQTTNQDGYVTFQTIFPGWYPGRTVHIHVKVWEGDQQVLTSQFFVTQADADTVYATAGYKGTQDTTNEQDRIAQQTGSGLAGLMITNSFANGVDLASARLVLG